MIFNKSNLKEPAFQRIDDFYNSFNIIKDIKSDLLYGNKNIDKEAFISVIIPTYSRSNLFEEALNSVLLQKKTKFVWEIIVIDNTPLSKSGSTPALDIVRKKDCERVLFYHNRENLGSGNNWNRGVELARGQWVTFLHDDDLLCSDALKNIGDIIFYCPPQQKPLAYIHAKRQDFSEYFDEKTAKKHDKPFLRRLTRTAALIKGCSQTGAPSCGTTILKEAYLNAGGTNPAFGGTADAILGYIIMRDYTVVESGKILGGYRWAENDTLHREVLLKLIETDFYFTQYRYSRTLFSKIFGILFWRVQHNENINKKMNLVEKYNLNIQKSEFNFITPYKENIYILHIMYKIVDKIYYFINKIFRINM